MLKKIRTRAAIYVFIIVFLLFAGVLSGPFAFIVRIQIVPAILAGSMFTVVAIVVTTLIFGRVYCSVVCPLGFLQDAISRLGKKRRFQFTRNRVWLRAGMATLFIVAFLFDLTSIVGVLEPYSAFGRIASELLTPIWAIGVNGLSVLAESLGFYLYFLAAPSPVWMNGVATMVLAVTTFFIISILAIKGGRTWCNTMCPMGTGLGFLAKHSLFKIRFVKHKCINCGLCSKNCKASCININNGVIDASRCVMCFDCLVACRNKALIYSPIIGRKHIVVPRNLGVASERRRFIISAVGLTALPILAVIAAKKPVNSAMAKRENESHHLPETMILPPGVKDYQQYSQRCTFCQVCVSLCPTNILRPHGGVVALQPSLSFHRGYCWEDCVECSKVCPTSAISPITVADKSTIRLGLAVHSRERCIVCKVCVQNCPYEAISLADNPGGKGYIIVNEDFCTGCGACEYFCPQAAIKVKGNRERHNI